jgi:hypothetical protein
VETTTQQRLFGIEGASRMTGLAAWRIYSEVAASRMPCKRVGRRIYFSEADIDTYLRRIQQNGTGNGVPGNGDMTREPDIRRGPWGR